MDFGVGHPEKIVDWAYRSVHVMTDVARLVVRDATGRFPDRAYFSGCSTGGQEALSEAQRYPRDYDGILAGDPGNNRLNLIYGFLWSWLAAHDAQGAPLLAPADLSLLTKSAVAACDARDGLVDGLIADPQRCAFDPATLTCRQGQTTGCLSAAQVQAVQKIYQGTVNPRTGKQIYPGWARGSEQGWRTYITEPREPVRLGLFTNFAFHDPAWDMHTFDWDRDVAYIDAQLPFLSAMSTDLSAFERAGGKLLMYTGLADPVVPPADPIAYYESVTQRMGGPATAKFFRFFASPGVAHCGGGAGPSPDPTDMLSALEQWVEHGRAPSTLLARHRTRGVVDRTRPVCPYPQVARYTGHGSIDEAANFTCTAPVRSTTR
jgi:feruloyl esterase